MSERTDLLASIAATIKPYRADEIDTPTPEHVDRWVSQFTPDSQLAFLRAFDPVIKRSFITKSAINTFLGRLVASPVVARPSPAEFWPKVNFLRVQQNGESQLEILPLLDGQLQEKLGISLDDCGGATQEYMYVDDIMFTGNRIGNDLGHWIANEAPQKARLHVVVAFSHTLGWYYMKERLNAAIQASGKNIRLLPRFMWSLETRRQRNWNADVLWPSELPEDQEIQDYAATGRFPLSLRRPGGSSKIFPSEQGRQVLEREFLIAGMKIRSQQANPKDILRPLGYGHFGVGFGSTLATYRNCPNTAPLALWWGDGGEGALQWYPLLPRKTYDS